MKKLKLVSVWVVTALFLALSASASLAAGNGNGYIKCAGDHGGSTFVYSDTVGGTRLAQTSVLQFIYAGADNVISPPDINGNPTGDDVLISTGTVGFPWNTSGEFFYFLDNMNDNARIYVRAWNASSIVAATKYGNSATYQINGGNPKPTPFIWNVPSFATTANKPVNKPTITASPNPITVTVTQGSNPANQTLTIGNSGNASLNYSISSNALWASPSPTSGTISAGGANQSITLSFFTSNLAVGSYSGTITVADPNATNSPINIPVNLIVTAASSLTISTAWDTSTAVNQTSAGFAWGQINISAAAGEFGTTKGNVRVNGTNISAAQIYYWDNSSISIGLAPSATLVAGPLSIQVITNGGINSNPDTTKSLKPRLWSLSTTEAPVGGPVTINGESFGTVPANVKVYFNGVAATAITAAGSTATVAVPAGATSGLITVEVNGQLSNSRYVIDTNSDGVGDAYGDNIYFTVKPTVVNRAPVANNSSATTAKNVPVNVTLSASDPDGNPLTYLIVSGPAHGTLGTVAGNRVTYTPASNYVGSDSFTFKANDGMLDSNIATVSLTVSDSAPLGPEITSILPATASIGQTIVISGQRFGANKGSSTITVGGITANPTRWSDNSITAIVPTGVPSGEVPVAVTVGGLSDSATLTINTISPLNGIVIDDFEGGCVGNFQEPAPTSGYYSFGLGLSPANDAINANLRQTTAKNEGAYGAILHYSYANAGIDDWGGGWGGLLANTLNLTGMTHIKLYLRGDGSANTFRIKLRAMLGTTEVALTSPRISLARGEYREVVIPLSEFSTENTVGVALSPTIDPAALATVVGYNLVYTDHNSSTAEHWIDYIAALATSETERPTGEATIISVDPKAAPAGAKITISYVSGQQFGANQGRSKVVFTNKETGASVDTTQVNSWSNKTIEAVVPNLPAGNYDVSVYVAPTAAGVDAFSTNPDAFQVTASGAVGTATIYPNPFNAGNENVNILITNTGGATTIGYYIFDMTARQVHKVVSGSTQITWDGKDAAGNPVADGAYLLRVINEDTKGLIARGKILAVKK